mmetsp:Transcript_21077/g.28980  ORF Transcript_21077/g.28980 Transcript_21077/m.28980 type:complete len:151 (-) Transcript_21077:338-790(-)
MGLSMITIAFSLAHSGTVVPLNISRTPPTKQYIWCRSTATMRVVWTALCCYFDDWLYVFPQLHLKLVYGDAIVKEAIPDFTVMDVESVLRMAVVKDKRRDGELEDSEPQLIAALIALFQADVGQKGSVKREARELHSIVGLRQVLVLPHR